MTTRTSPTLNDLDTRLDKACRGVLRAAQALTGVAGVWLVASSSYLYLHATASIGEDGARYVLGPCVGFALLALALFTTAKGRSERVEAEWREQVAADILERYSTTIPVRTLRPDTHPRVVYPRGAPTSFTGGFPDETTPYQLAPTTDTAPANEKVTQ